MKTEYKKLSLHLLVNNQSIKDFDVKKYHKLKTQIEKNGQIQTLLVWFHDDIYEIIDGFNRLNIFKELNYEHAFCCVISDCSKEKIDKMKIELLLQQDFSVLEVAKIFNVLLKKIHAKQLEETVDFTSEQIKKYSELFNWDWSIFNQEELPQEFRDKKLMKNKELF